MVLILQFVMKCIFFVMLVAFASRESAVLKNNMNCINYINTVAIITNTVYLVRSGNDVYA